MWSRSCEPACLQWCSPVLRQRLMHGYYEFSKYMYLPDLPATDSTLDMLLRNSDIPSVHSF